MGCVDNRHNIYTFIVALVNIVHKSNYTKFLIYIYITRLYWKSYTVYIHYTPKQSVLFEKEKWHTSI